MGRVDRDDLRVARDAAVPTVGADAELDLRQGLGVLPGLKDRCPVRGGPGVVLVRVAAQDEVDVGGDILRDLPERLGRRGVGLDRGGTVERALVQARDDHVDVRVLGQLTRDPVDRVDGVADRQVRNAGGGDERGQGPGDDADDGDVQPAGLDDRVLLQAVGHVLGARVVHVRGQVGHVGVVGDDAVAEVAPALVELVVAGRDRVDADGGQDVEGRLVVQDPGDEGGAPDVVALAEQDDVVVALGRTLLLDGGEECGGAFDAPVEVVEAEEAHGAGGVGAYLAGGGAGRCRACQRDAAGDQRRRGEARRQASRM